MRLLKATQHRYKQVENESIFIGVLKLLNRRSTLNYRRAASMLLKNTNPNNVSVIPNLAVTLTI